jgi:hypothetical protein|tara:strand:+ start:252 stop:386 length:135 start_codon:yes stop_codon:yes gene_type:complete
VGEVVAAEEPEAIEPLGIVRLLVAGVLQRVHSQQRREALSLPLR